MSVPPEFLSLGHSLSGYSPVHVQVEIIDSEFDCCLCSDSPTHVFLVAKEIKEGVRFHGTGIINGCELPCGFLEMKLGLMEEQAIILTSKPSLRFEFFKAILIF